MSPLQTTRRSCIIKTLLKFIKIIMKNVLLFIVMLGFVSAIFILLSISFSKSKDLECEKLEKQAKEYPLFFYSKSQKLMCNII